MRLPLQFLTVAMGTLMSCNVFASDSTAATALTFTERNHWSALVAESGIPKVQ
jgi:hypothetical protein